MSHKKMIKILIIGFAVLLPFVLMAVSPKMDEMRIDSGEYSDSTGSGDPGGPNVPICY